MKKLGLKTIFLETLPHVFASVIIGIAMWIASGNPHCVSVAIVVGSIVDLDHIIDLFDSIEDGQLRHMWRFLHAWEYSIVLLLVAIGQGFDPLVVTALLSYTAHLLMDQISNHPVPLAYSILFRASAKFRRKQLTPRLFE